MMQRNEINNLEPWIRYHGYLFGINNLCVIDHGSTDKAVIDVLSTYQDMGMQIRHLSAEADFKFKGKYITETLSTLDAFGLYDFFIPLDCDEFVSLKTENGRYTCCKNMIMSYIQKLRNKTCVLEVKENLINFLGQPGKFLNLPYQKIFFTAKNCGVVDDGSHRETSGLVRGSEVTRLAYIHFHLRPYALQIEASLQKLRPYVDVKDLKALKSYTGPGWHLIPHILEGEEKYLEIMKYEPPVEVDGLLELFKKLGINPLFTEGSG